MSEPRAEYETADSAMQIRDQREPGWCWLDNDVLDNYGPQLGPTGVAVYTMLCRYAGNRSQQCWPSIGTLAKGLGIGRSTVQRALGTIKELGLVAIEERQRANGSQTSNLYTLLTPPCPTETRGVGQTDTGGGYQNDLPGTRPTEPDSENYFPIADDRVATPPPAPTCFSDWLAILKEPRTADGGKSNRNAVLVWMHHALYPEHDPPEFGYIGKVARQVGGAARLAQLLWEHATRPPVGDVLAYIVAAEQGRKKQERGARAARGGNGPDGTLEEFMRLGLEGR